MMRDTNGKPILRDDYEGFLRAWMENWMKKETGSRLPVLEGAEAFVVAALLDELASVYTKEPLGQLAWEMAVRLNDRRGI